MASGNVMSLPWSESYSWSASSSRVNADRGEQVGPADVADEQRVAGEDAVGGGAGIDVGGALPDDDAHRLGRVPGGVPEFEHDGVVARSERVALAVGHTHHLELGARHGRVDDLRPGRLGELEVARQEVGVEVRLDHELDRHARLGCVGEVLGHVTLGIDDHGSAARLVADEVRRMRQALQVVLVELHESDSFRSRWTLW